MPEDIVAVQHLCALLDPSDYAIDAWTHWPLMGSGVNVVAEVRGRIVGCIHGETVTTSEGWLQALRVHPGARRRGIGLQLLLAGQAALEHLGVDIVRASIAAGNRPSLQLFHHAEWQLLGQVRRRRAPGRAGSTILSRPTVRAAWRLLRGSPVLASRSRLARFGRVYFSWTLAYLRKQVKLHVIAAIPDEPGLAVLDPAGPATMGAIWVVAMLGSPTGLLRLMDGVRAEADRHGHDVIIDSPGEPAIQEAMDREGFGPPDRNGDFILVQRQLGSLGSRRCLP